MLARLFLAFPVGLALITLSGMPDPNLENLLVLWERFAEVLKPRN
jgi:hypothetical protein